MDGIACGREDIDSCIGGGIDGIVCERGIVSRIEDICSCIGGID